MSKLRIMAKCSDLCYCEFTDDSGHSIEHDGYVPSGIGISEPWGGGDYVEITIDATTGQIEGWKPLNMSKVSRAFRDA